MVLMMSLRMAKVSGYILMQFHGRDIQRMIHACEYYGSLVRSHDATLASHLRQDHS